MFAGLSDPIAVQKLVRHFARNSGVAVRLDYTDNVTPHTSQAQDGSITVTIPAWIKADDLARLLAACLHESGHVEFDQAGMDELNKALRNATLPVWTQYLHNVVTDARIDARRCAAFAGARGLYAESWAKADETQKGYAGKRSTADDAKMRVHLTCLGALAAALGFEADAPWIAAGPFAQHPKRDEIIALLRGCAGTDSTLLPEAFRLLALLALDPSIPPPTSPQARTPSLPQVDWTEADDPALGAFDEETATACKRGGIKTTLREPGFREHMRKAANRVFAGGGLQTIQTDTGISHTSPATFGDAITPFSRAELTRARTEFIGDAVQAFVESTREVIGEDEYRYRIDAERLPLIVSDPLGVLVGDTVRPAPNCAVDIVLDVSGSMQGAMSGAKQTTRMSALLHALATWMQGAEALGASGVTVGIRLFATASGRHLDFTELSGVDPKALTGRAIEASASRTGCGGGTNCRIGLEASIRDLQGQPARRRAVLLITDGAILQDDYAWMAKEWPDGVALAVLAVSEDAGGMFGTDNEVFKFRALTVEEVAPMLASAMRESVEHQAARG